MLTPRRPRRARPPGDVVRLQWCSTPRVRVSVHAGGPAGVHSDAARTRKGGWAERRRVVRRVERKFVRSLTRVGSSCRAGVQRQPPPPPNPTPHAHTHIPTHIHTSHTYTTLARVCARLPHPSLGGVGSTSVKALHSLTATRLRCPSSRRAGKREAWSICAGSIPKATVGTTVERHEAADTSSCDPIIVMRGSALTPSFASPPTWPPAARTEDLPWPRRRRRRRAPRQRRCRRPRARRNRGATAHAAQ